MPKKVLALSARAYLIGVIDEDSRCGFPFSRLLEGRNSCRREDFFLHFSDHLFDETKLSTVQHKCIRENPRTVKFNRKGGLINFPPLKRGGLLERGGLFEMGGLIEDLRYFAYKN